LIKSRKNGFLEKTDVPVCQTEQSDFQSVHSAIICSAEPNSVEPNSLISKIGGCRISKTSDETSKTTTVSLNDWRTPLVRYLENLGYIADKKV
jgi:hypothetical protein